MQAHAVCRARVRRIRASKDRHTGRSKFAHGRFGKFLIESRAHLWERSLQILTVRHTKIRLQARVAGERFTAWSAAHAFQHGERRHDKRMMLGHKSRKVRSRRNVGEQMCEPV